MERKRSFRWGWFPDDLLEWDTLKQVWRAFRHYQRDRNQARKRNFFSGVLEQLPWDNTGRDPHPNKPSSLHQDNYCLLNSQWNYYLAVRGTPPRRHIALATASYNAIKSPVPFLPWDSNTPGVNHMTIKYCLFLAMKIKPLGVQSLQCQQCLKVSWSFSAKELINNKAQDG